MQGPGFEPRTPQKKNQQVFFFFWEIINQQDKMRWICFLAQMDFFFYNKNGILVKPCFLFFKKRKESKTLLSDSKMY